MVRRFRTCPEVRLRISAARFQSENSYRRSFPLSGEEEAACLPVRGRSASRPGYREVTRGRAIDLFRTTLAKAIFSSPVACLETLERRMQG